LYVISECRGNAARRPEKHIAALRRIYISRAFKSKENFWPRGGSASSHGVL
jgi:hypothetical protein